MSLSDTPPCFRILTGLSFFLLSLFFADRVQAEDTRTEFWPEVDVFYKLNEKSRLYFFYSATKLDNRETYADGSIAGYLDFYTLPLLGRRHRPSADAARSKLLGLGASFHL